MKNPKDNLLVKSLVAQILGRMQYRSPADISIERYGIEGDNMTLARSLMASTMSSGGAIIPFDLNTQLVVNALTPLTVIRQRVPAENFVEMPYGNVEFGRVNAPATGGIIGEGAPQKSPTLPGFGQLSMTSKKIWASAPVSNSALRFGAPELETIIAAQLMRAYAVTEDGAFISGLGSVYSPKGLIVSAATNVAATSNPIADLKGALGQLEGASVPMVAPLWITTPAVKETLQTHTASGSGNFVFDELNKRGTILGIPMEATTAVPSGTVILVDCAELLIGTAFIETKLMPAATYTDSAGVLRSAFDQDETVIRITVGCDMIAKHSEAIAVLNSVSWS